MFRIVITFSDFREATRNFPRIKGGVALSSDEVTKGGRLVQVMTPNPEAFIASYFAEGYVETFTCQLESL